MPSISLPLHSYQLRAAQASTSRLVNCFLEQLPPDAKVPAVLQRTPGIVSWATVGNGPILAMHAAHGLLYVVSGGMLYSVTDTGVATARGAVGSPTVIDIDSNDTSVVVTTNPDSYYWDGSTFAQITDAQFLGSTDVEFVDNFLLFIDPGTGVFFGADLGSDSDFDALNFATAEGHPDDIVGMKADHRQVILFGEKTTEVWATADISGFPFQRLEPGFMEIGCLSPGRTIAKLDNSVFWLADDYTVRRLDGLTPARVSTHAVEQWIRGCTASSARAWTYAQEGHFFYVLSFTEGTRVFDVTTQLWHERQTYSENNWQWNWPTAFDGQILVGSTTSNVVGYLSSTTYDENSLTLIAEWTYQPVYMEGRRVFHDKLELMFERGRALTSGQGSAAEVMLDLSDDGGRTWTALPNRSLGEIGRYAHKCVWHGLGSSSDRVYRVRVSDPIPVALTDSVLTYRVGR